MAEKNFYDDDEEDEREDEDQEVEDESEDQGDADADDADDESEESEDDQGDDESDDEDESTADDGAAAGTGAREKKLVPIQAVHEERRKVKGLRGENQKLQERLDALEKRLGSLKIETEKPRERAKFKFDKEKLYEAPEEVFEQFATWSAQQRAEERWTDSIDDARADFDDYDEVIKRDYPAWAAANPEQAARAIRSRSPATFVYRQCVKHRKKLESERKAGGSKEVEELKAELQKTREELKKLSDRGADRPPRNIAGTRGTSRPGRSRSSEKDDAFDSSW